MKREAIYHIPNVPYAYGQKEENLYLKIRTAKNDMSKVTVYYKDRHQYDQPFLKQEMDWIQGDSLFDYYEVVLHNVDNKFRYFFELNAVDGEQVFYNERGLLNEMPDVPQTFQFPYLCIGDLYREVRWAQEGVMYQIFPDRFCNGDTSNDPSGVKVWGEKVGHRDFFGGDIKGITSKLDYLKELGVSIIYTTPIFLSTSNHKYNTKDYYRIDPIFGTNEDFKELVMQAHSRDIRVILDAVFNHTGDDFFAFVDVMEKGEESKYKDWYYIKSFPVNQKNLNYITFYDRFGAMPKLNMSNPATIEYFVNVGRYWIKEFGIDGWRLDVCDEIDHLFLKAFYRAVKEENREAIVIGEIMHANNSFCNGDELDSTMNYPFREAVLDFFGLRNMDAKSFTDILAIRRHGLMKSIHKQMLNLLDSHDTSRFLTDANEDVERLVLASAFQYTYQGIPYIYYGDEVGLKGGYDPDCRRCMIWEEEKQDRVLFDHFKQLAKLRRDNRELIDGEFEVLLAEDAFLIYRRYLDDSDIIVAINNSDKSEMKVCLSKGRYINLYTNELMNIEKELELKPMSFVICKKC
jgi:glycosidase